MTFTEDWFCEESQQALADLYQPVRDLEGAVVEVGCWQGRSTVALANACYPEDLHAVDHWYGSPGEVSSEIAATRNVYDEFLANVCALTKGNVQVHRMGWRDYFDLNHCRSAPVKFIHIDATHSYQEVRENIEAVRPLMVKGGIICGDDNHHPPVQRAVIDTLGPQAQIVASLWWFQC